MSYVKEILKPRYPNELKGARVSYLSNKEIGSKTLKSEMLRLLMRIDPNVLPSSNIFKEVFESFNNYKSCNRNSLVKFLSQIVEHSYRDLVLAKVFSQIRHFEKGKTYDYVSVFNLKLFSSLRVLTFLGNQLPMIVKPLD